MKKPITSRSLCRASYPSIGTRISILLTLGGSLVFSGVSLGDTKTWDGGTDSDSFWSTGENWDPSTLTSDGVAPVAGDDLVFDGSTNLFTENDFGDSFGVNSITFPATAGPFELSGDSLDMNGKTITNDSSDEQVIYNTLEETGSGFVIDGDGDLYLDDIQCSAWGHDFVKNGGGTVEVGNRNDSWQIQLNDGTVKWSETSGNGIAKTSNINGGVLEFAGGVDPIHYNATLNMPNSSSSPTPATLLISGNISTTFKDLHGAAGSHIGSLGTTGETATLQLRGNSDFAGTIEDSTAGGKTAVTMLNEIAGQTLTLSGENTFTGDLTVQSGSALNLTAASTHWFFPEPGGVCNKITGTGSVTINGEFAIDLGGVGTPTSGDSWALVDAPATYGSTFTVALPFAETSVDSGIWSYDDGSDVYYFSETNGTLSYGRTAETIWGGAGGDALWSTMTNWDQNPLSGDLLVFDGSTQTTNTNDLDTSFVAAVYDTEDPPNLITPEDPASFLVGGIRFESTADPFVLEGNPIDFSGKTITNNSPNTQTFDLQIQTDANVSNGSFTVDTAAGDVVLGELFLRNGYTKPLVKVGSETLFINGPLVGPETWNPKVNAGTMVAAWTGGNLFYHVDIAAGATLQTEGNVIHNGGRVNNNGTLDLAEGVNEDVGALFGSGVVTNHGVDDTISTISIRQSDNRTFSGIIEDGPSGGKTAVQVGLATRSDAGVFTLSGSNSYTGNTTMGQAFASLVLDTTSSLTFAPEANGVTNQITALVDQNTGTGTISINGEFAVDLSGADVTNGNSWTLVDSANLNEAYGETFQITNGVANFMADTPLVDQWQLVDGGNTWTFDEASGVLSLAVGGGSGGYSDWLAGYPGMTLTGRNEDDENDGRANVIEFYVNGDPTVSDPQHDPQGVMNGANFELSFSRNDDALGDTVATIYYGTNLSGWTMVLVPETSDTVDGVTFTITDNGTDPDDIIASIPTGGATEFFARLGVE